MIWRKFHTYVFERERFDREALIITENISRRSTAGKARWQELEDQALSEGKFLLLQEDLKAIQAMRESLYSKENEKTRKVLDPDKWGG